MTEDNKLIGDLTGLSKPLSKLVEAVSNGIGALYEPSRIRRKAKADADALLVLTESEIKSEELKRRADERAYFRELRRQRNIENITAKAAKELPEHVDEKPVNEDWIVQYFNLSQDVGDEDMQTLWARLLAGEVACPGLYSLRTLQTVKVLRKDDAELFTKFCSYVWMLEDNMLFRFNTQATQAYLTERGIGSIQRRHLKNLGLIDLSLGIYTPIPKEAIYFGRKYSFTINSREKETAWGDHLTDIGVQLFPISGAQPDEQYLQLLIESMASEDKIAITLKSS